MTDAERIAYLERLHQALDAAMGDRHHYSERDRTRLFDEKLCIGDVLRFLRDGSVAGNWQYVLDQEEASRLRMGYQYRSVQEGETRA